MRDFAGLRRSAAGAHREGVNDSPALKAADFGLPFVSVDRRRSRGARRRGAPGVSVETILQEVWSPRARDARNRESGLTARRLDALGLGLDAMNILARAHRDVGQHAAAMTVYGEMLTEDAFGRRAQEGLVAAAGVTGDAAQLTQAWQQVCASPEGALQVLAREVFGGQGQEG